MYDEVVRCNIVLDRIDRVTFSSQELKQRYIAEVKFIRALLYFHLERKSADISLAIEEITTKDQAYPKNFSGSNPCAVRTSAGTPFQTPGLFP